KENKSINIIFWNITKGNYELKIYHDNEKIFKNRKKIWAIFEIAGSANSKYIADKIQLNYGKPGIFSYMGSGHRNNDKNISEYWNVCKFNIVKDKNFILVSIKSSEEFHLNGISLRNISEAKKLSIQDSFKIDINKLKSKIRSTYTSKTVVVYANISANVADGSSIWLSSIVNIISNKSKVILILKENLRNRIIISNIKNIENVVLVEPCDYSNIENINENQALNLIKLIDDFHPNLRAVLVRGVQAAKELTLDRKFKYRSICYLTDFYTIENNEVIISNLMKNDIWNIMLHTHLLLVQTKQIKNRIFSLIGREHPNYAYLPPSLPDSLFKRDRLLSGNGSIIKDRKNYISIGYAGKIMPNWGVEELLEWVIEFNKKNKSKLKIYLAANKISAPGEQRKPFVAKILKLIKEADAIRYTDFNREQCIQLLSEVDYVWAYRPGSFENNTLELSTKLLEAIAMQQKVLCYPSVIHTDEIGQNYPFYIKNKEDFFKILKNENYKTFNRNDLAPLAEKLEDTNSISKASVRLEKYSPLADYDNLLPESFTGKKICFAGHDFKFIDPYISYLKSVGFLVFRDQWEWGSKNNNDESREVYNNSDIIFCEWGLGNAVFYSHNNPEKKPLFIRIHLQEINERAKKFGYKINSDSVTKFIFVSDLVRDEYIKLFNVPYEKTIVIPNFVLDDEFFIQRKIYQLGKPIKLGMVGIVPQRKRLDRAIKVLELLTNIGVNAELHIKGHRPENLEFMKGPSRVKELDYYYSVYNDIKNKNLEQNVKFDGWGNDVAKWYQNIDFILSPSDFESFHYALADGILSGCLPLIWNWKEASDIYRSEWIVNSEEEAVESITQTIRDIDIDKKINANRDFIVNKYGKDIIFRKLTNIIFEN
ncbi:glycosyltransferase family 4 protein, partial [Avibacterium gallinarum]